MGTTAAFEARRHTTDQGDQGSRVGPQHAAGGRPGGRQWAHWLGRYGEQAAAQYLIGAGYQVLDRNWACRDPDLRGELDLIARYRRVVVACEVKTRAGDLLAHPAQAVTREKAARLRLLAARWLREHQGGSQPSLQRVTRLRIDVIAIRTGPRPPYPLRSLDHLVGVA